MENGFQKEREQLKRMQGTVESCPFRTRYHIMPPVGWLNDPERTLSVPWGAIMHIFSIPP